MLDLLVRLVRVIHMTIGISEPKPTEERAIALVGADYGALGVLYDE
jgi:hypothetical protein